MKALLQARICNPSRASLVLGSSTCRQARLRSLSLQVPHCPTAGARTFMNHPGWKECIQGSFRVPMARERGGCLPWPGGQVFPNPGGTGKNLPSPSLRKENERPISPIARVIHEDPAPSPDLQATSGVLGPRILDVLSSTPAVLVPAGARTGLHLRPLATDLHE